MSNNTAFEQLFSPTFPVGPISAPPITADPEIQRLVFDEHNELYESMNHGITLLVGRKGSGKTSLLNSVSLTENGPIIIALDSGESADIFTRIVDEIDALSSDTALVEQVSKLWEVVIWGVVFRFINEKIRDELLHDYLDGFSILEFDGLPYEIIDRQIAVLKEFPPSARPVAQKVRYTKVNGITFMEAKNRAIQLFHKNNINAFVLIDSLEDYALHKFENSMALSGLLKFLGDATAERTPCIIRCCIPAEKYHLLMSISSNPIKDFQGHILLHWDAGDLVKICAKRYAAYLKYYEPDFFDKEISYLDLEKRKNAFRFWDKFFPLEIINRNKISEKPVAYILRHTQLLPRHFILIMTQILRRSIKIDKSPFKVSERHIVDGVFEAENEIRAQILEAYQAPIHIASDACKQFLPELKTHFTWDDFDAVAAKRSGVLRAVDKIEILEALIEIGAVGRHVTETGCYEIASYEYMMPHRLITSHRDTFCIHPVFTETYSANSKYEGAKPIYTYWSENVPDELI